MAMTDFTNNRRAGFATGSNATGVNGPYATAESAMPDHVRTVLATCERIHRARYGETEDIWYRTQDDRWLRLVSVGGDHRLHEVSHDQARSVLANCLDDADYVRCFAPDAELCSAPGMTA